ncbi:response regulator transcription factor [Chitinophaga sp. Cy-1792]|uniref:response regulator transcription factor n=1 Tax=Chitinophaga sp. Cy-1792 TaxID=2608339 RepID=UPI00142109E9|nr:response regulator transcription factor [Chitinophaga sp. Cy-1792]NIG56687.1 response regulator transcription factor [Chitinophaga sp. Cy-1792]
MQENIIRIALVDDHHLFRQGLISLLSEYEEISLVFEAANGLEMQEKMRAGAMPQVVLLDINMPLADGYASAQWLRQHYPGVHILALSTFEDDKPVIKMLKSGAGGYLLKESRIGDVVSAIKGIHEQGFYLNDLVSGKMLRNLQGHNGTDNPLALLSDNEVRFLQLCCSELTYKEIAAEMKLSPHTIDNYRQELFDKLEIKSRTGLVLFAIRHELYVP